MTVTIETVRTMKRVSSLNSNDALDINEDGIEGTLGFRLQAVEPTKGQSISLWHDISLEHIDPQTGEGTGYLNFVCEIPKFTRKKYEIATSEVGNPIKQDEKKGVLREFKKGDIFFNYGCFPQTWEDPTFKHPDANGCRGDNDPLDVVEIGARIVQPGNVANTKEEKEELKEEPNEEENNNSDERERNAVVDDEEENSDTATPTPGNEFMVSATLVKEDIDLEAERERIAEETRMQIQQKAVVAEVVDKPTCSRKSWFWWVLVALVVVMMAAGLGVGFRRRDPPVVIRPPRDAEAILTLLDGLLLNSTVVYPSNGTAQDKAVTWLIDEDYSCRQSNPNRPTICARIAVL